MGFPIVEIRLPQLAGDQPAVLDRWLVSVGDFIDANKPIAAVVLAGEPHELICNMPVIIKDISAEAVGLVDANQLLCFGLVEATEIPYGRPYSRLEKIA